MRRGGHPRAAAGPGGPARPPTPYAAGRVVVRDAAVGALVSLAGAAAAGLVDGAAAAVVGAFGAAWLWRELPRVRRRRRIAAIDAQTAAACDLLARSLGAGASLAQAFAVCAERLGPPLGAAFRAAGAAADAGRSRPGAALAAYAAHGGSAAFRLAAGVLADFEERGGPVVGALVRVAGVARSRRALAAEQRAALAQSRTSGIVIAALPVVARLLLPQPAAPSPLLSAAGWGLAAIGLVLLWRIGAADPRRLALRTRHRTRHAAADGVADCCDLLAISFAAGANLHAAVTAVAAGLDGPLGAAFASAHAAIGRGARPDEALASAVGPLGCDDADEVVAALAEVRRSGGPAADTFAALGADARLRARLDATTRLRRMPVLALVPLVGCVLPSFVLLVVSPMLGAVLAGHSSG